MYRLSGTDKLFAWLEHEPNANNRQAMLDWFAEMAQDPHAYGQRLPGRHAPVYLSETFVRGVTVEFLVAEQFRAVHIIQFARLP